MDFSFLKASAAHDSTLHYLFRRLTFTLAIFEISKPDPVESEDSHGQDEEQRQRLPLLPDRTVAK